MSVRLIGGDLPGGPSKAKAAGKVDEIGCCVVCKRGIFSDQEYGRAPKPALGKAHVVPCGGVVA